MDAQVFWESEVESFARIFFATHQTKADQQKLYAVITPAIDRFKALESPKQEDFKKQLTAFIRAYVFLARSCHLMIQILKRSMSLGGC